MIESGIGIGHAVTSHVADSIARTSSFRTVPRLNCNSLYVHDLPALSATSQRILLSLRCKLVMFDIATVQDDSEMGYFVECDLQYLYHLHELHNAHLLALEQVHIAAVGWIRPTSSTTIHCTQQPNLHTWQVQVGTSQRPAD